MDVKEIEKLRHDRAARFERMKEIHDSAEAEGRDLKAEEKQEYERVEGEFDSLSERIEREERIAGIGKRNVPHEEETREAPAPGVDSEEYRQAFDAYLRVRGGESQLDAEQRAALKVGTASQGGYTVPESWADDLTEASREFGVIRELATVITTSDGRKIHYPTVATFPTAALTAEEAAFTESEGTFGDVELDAYKYGSIAKVSDELRQDSMFDIDGLVQRFAGQAIALAEDAQLSTGTGTNQPQGLLTGLSTGKTTAGVSAVTTDELVDLFHSVLSPYRANGSWLFADATAAAIRKLKDSTNQYIWQPGLQAGQPDMLLGRPVYTDPFIEALGTGNDVGVFGDIGRAYLVRNAGGVEVKVLEELYAANGQVGIRVHRRTDGAVIDAAAAKKLTNA